MFIVFMVLGTSAQAEWRIVEGTRKVKDAVVSDFKAYYSLDVQVKAAIGMAVSGIIANTEVDENIQEWYQEDLRDEETDDVSKAVKELGDWQKATPLYLALAVSGALCNENRFMGGVGLFGERSFRALLAGMPSVLFWQLSLGAARPSDQEGSRWRPGEDNNSVSGHAFTGAVPFLTAASMTDNLCLKAIFFLGSSATAFSRINDDQHYLSQAILGWWFAFLAVGSVDRVASGPLTLSPMVSDDGGGVVATLLF